MAKKQSKKTFKIPKGMTEEEVLAVIKDVVKTCINSSMTFGYYDLEELRAEATLECILALERYDGKRPLENFLKVNCKNRYRNLRRNKFHRVGDSDDHPKKLLVMPIDLDSVDHEGESNMSEMPNISGIDHEEIWQKIDSELDIDLRHDYLRLKNGEEISRAKRIRIIEAIKDILWGQASDEN